MKLTAKRLKQIIREEMEKILEARGKEIGESKSYEDPSVKESKRRK